MFISLGFLSRHEVVCAVVCRVEMPSAWQRLQALGSAGHLAQLGD